MRKECFKVSEQDYKKLQFINNLSEEDKQRNRLETIKGNERRIIQLERFRDHKKEQIEKNESVELHPNYKDGKPIFMIQNEVEETDSQIEQLKEVNKAAQEEYDKNYKND